MENDHTITNPADEVTVKYDKTKLLQSGELTSYFKRIRFTGSLIPTLDTLKAIHLLHPQAIPFENLNPLLGIPISLELSAIQEKLVHQQRGGYCFEHNLLLSAVLRTIGFKVVDLAARVQWNLPEEVVTARSHMLLMVEVENNRYIADVGFGGNTLTAPLLLQPDTVQETPHGTFRLRMVGEEYQLQVNVNGLWKALYKFGLQEQLLPDYEVASWYLSNHPQSHFVTSLVAASVENECRYSLRNNHLAIHHTGMETEKFQLKDAEEIKEALKTKFKIKLPDVATLEDILARLSAGPAST